MAARFTNHRGFVLACLAAMDYASYVESKGRDVITGSSQLAADELKRAMDNLQEKINKRA